MTVLAKIDARRDEITDEIAALRAAGLMGPRTIEKLEAESLALWTQRQDILKTGAPFRSICIMDCDPDYRRDPKTPHFCHRCQKDLKPGQPTRWVHVIAGGVRYLHPEDEAAYVDDGGNMNFFPVGLDCAKRIGLEWSVVSPDLDAMVVEHAGARA